MFLVMKQQLTNYRFRFWFCSLIIISTYANAQWNTIYTSTVTSLSYPYQLSYTTDSAIFVATKKEFIYSKNNGLSFTGTNSFVTTPTVSAYNTHHDFADISFANKDTGSIVGHSNVGAYSFPFAQSSTGNFTSWNLNHTIIPSASLIKINTVKHFKNKKVYAFDNNTNLYYSTNGGSSWILKNTINTATPIYGFGMSMVNEQLGYFATQQGIFKTTDGGLTKSYVPGFPSAYLYNIIKIRFRDASIGYIIAANNLGENKLFKTTNGGNTWQDVFQGKLPDALVDVSFPSNDTGFVATASYILQTFNGGLEWYIQRFTNTGFNELEFIDKTNGVAVAQTGGSSLKVMKYIPNSISNNPFAVFNFQTNYCCNGQVCNITNFGSPSWTYKWYVNNVLSSTAFTPSGLILPNTGNNAVKLVSTNGANKDSVSLTVYNAPVFFGGGNFNIVCYDSTICKNSQAILYVGNYSSQMGYAAFSNSVQISPWVSQTSGNLQLNTTGLNFNDTIITVKAVTGYSNCPGNIYSKTQNIKVLPLPPSNLMSLLRDSICYMDSVGMVISPCTSQTTYTVFHQNSTPLKIFASPSNSSYTYYYKNMGYSHSFYYSSLDSNGCKMTNSPLLHVKVDSMWTKLKTFVPATLLGDTIILKNESVAVNYFWNFSVGTNVVSNNDTLIKLKYPAIGTYSLSLFANNLTGCKDSLEYFIKVYNPLNQGNGQTLCFSDTTALIDDRKAMSPLAWFREGMIHNRFHTDINENYYISKNVFYGDPNQTSADLYGQIGFKLLKYDKLGNLKWEIKPNFSGMAIGPYGGGPRYVHSSIESITSDINGNIYITGSLRGNIIKIGNVSRTFSASNAVYLANAFIAKIDSLGNCKWILAMNKSINPYDTKPASVGKLVFDNPNAIYFKTDFLENAVFTNTVINMAGAHGYMMVIDTGGNLKRYGIINETDNYQFGFSSMVSNPNSTSNLFTNDYKLIKYKDKLIYYTSTNSSSVQLFNGPMISSPSISGYGNSSFMSYVIITDTMGNLLNYFKPAILYDSIIGNANYTNDYEYLPNISVDTSGYIYFQWSIYEAGTSQYYYSLYNKLRLKIFLNDNSTINKSDPFTLIVKYDLNGNVLWHKEANFLLTKSFVANNDGNIYGLGRFYNHAGFESADGNNQMITSTDSCRHILLYSYDASGNFLFAKNFPEIGIGNQYPYEMLKKDNCNSDLYFSASFDTISSFLSTTNLINKKLNIFKFSPDGNCNEINCIPTSTLVTGINSDITNTTNLFQVAPNPNKGQFSIHSNSKEELFIQVYNSTGQLIAEVNVLPDSPDVLLDIANSGVYYVMAKGKTVKGGQKILVIK